jgi:hypothetical protein
LIEGGDEIAEGLEILEVETDKIVQLVVKVPFPAFCGERSGKRENLDTITRDI